MFLIIGAVICVASALRVLIVNYITDGACPGRPFWGADVLQPPLYPVDLPAFDGGDGRQRPLCGGAGGPYPPIFPHAPCGKGKALLFQGGGGVPLCAFDLAVLYVVSTVAQVGLGGGTEGILTSLGACLLDLIPPGGAGSFLLPDQSAGERVQPDGPAVCGFVHRAAGYGDLSARGGGLVFTGYLRWHNLWIGIALPFFSLLPRIGLLAGYGLVFGCCGYLLFDRKEA